MDDEATLPLPEDPALAAAAAALNATGHWAEIVDHSWRLVYVTDELRRSYAGLRRLEPVTAIGEHYFGPVALQARLALARGASTIEIVREMFARCGGVILADTPGGREGLRDQVDPALRGLVDEITPAVPEPMTAVLSRGRTFGDRDVQIPVVLDRIHDSAGRLAGTAIIFKPEPGMATLATMAASGDPRHLERTQRVAGAARRPAAILFADLESSSPLSRRLSTASYFALGRRLVLAADQCVIEAGGMVGRHVGDGVVAFFLAETAGSESSAARNCIAAARTLRSAMSDVAVRSDLVADDVVLRFGLHWGSTLYVGMIETSGRTEIGALGDEVNETARIEACATSGLALASKSLLERLDPDDALALGLDPGRITYTPLSDLTSATEKARRDAPSIAVCEV